MFYNCESLNTIPTMNTGNVTDMQYMFHNCKSLNTIPTMNTGNVTDMQYMFYNCKSLNTIPTMNTENVTNMRYMFTGCSSLSDDTLNNVLQMCINATKITNKNLSYLGLDNTQRTKCITLSNYQEFVNAGWVAD